MEIGSYLILSYEGEKPSQKFKDIIAEYNVFGLLLFAQNIQDKDTLKDTLADLQTVKKNVSPNPLAIFLDHEGGFVVRNEKLIPWIPSASAQSIGGSIEDTFILHFECAKAMHQIGIHINFCPVLDRLPLKKESSINIRSFGSDTQNIIKYGSAAIKGLEAGGVLPCVKHFPGIGESSIDSHYGLPKFSLDKATFDKNEKSIYKQVTLSEKMVMVGHGCYSFVKNKKIPASLNSEICQNIFRQELNMQGVLISDDIAMGALKSFGSVSSRAFKSIIAGVDLITLCHQSVDQLKFELKALNDYLHQSKLIVCEHHSERLKKVYDQINKNIKKPTEKVDKEHLNKTINRVSTQGITIKVKQNFQWKKTIRIMTTKPYKENWVEECVEILQFKTILQNLFKEYGITVLFDPDIHFSRSNIESSLGQNESIILIAENKNQIKEYVKGDNVSNISHYFSAIILTKVYDYHLPLIDVCDMLFVSRGFHSHQQRIIAEKMLKLCRP